MGPQGLFTSFRASMSFVAKEPQQKTVFVIKTSRCRSQAPHPSSRDKFQWTFSWMKLSYNDAFITISNQRDIANPQLNYHQLPRENLSKHSREVK